MHFVSLGYYSGPAELLVPVFDINAALECCRFLFLHLRILALKTEGLPQHLRVRVHVSQWLYPGGSADKKMRNKMPSAVTIV